jgi:DNA-binding NarL/FixJ family response regulator
VDELKEECGVFGIFGHPEAANLAYLGLYALQHRGQESAGIAAADGHVVTVARGMGYVADIFDDRTLSGLTGLMYLRSQHPQIPVVIVSATDNASMVRRCANLGASGFISKSLPVDKIRQAVKTILDGGLWFSDEMRGDGASDELGEMSARLATLTPQQVRVLSMLGKGLLNKQIAYELSVSEATVKAHVSAILQKLGVDSRTQAVIAVNRIASVDEPDGTEGA